jgi:hypothetical protein
MSGRRSLARRRGRWCGLHTRGDLGFRVRVKVRVRVRVRVRFRVRVRVT